MEDYMLEEYYDPEQLEGQMSLDDYEWDLADNYNDEKKLRKGIETMERKVIDLNNTNITFDEILNLDNYIWKNDKLIPSEMIEGE